MLNLVKILIYIKCYSASRPVENYKKILSDSSVRISAVDQEDLKPYRKLEKRSYFSRWPRNLFFTSFSETLLTTGRRLIGGRGGGVGFSCWTVPNIHTDESFRQSGKQDSLRHISKSSANMYESSGS